MAVNLVKGNTFEAACKGIFKQIEKNDIKNNKHIIVVPEQYELDTKMDLLNSLNLTSTFNVEVLSFSALINSFLEKSEKFISNNLSLVLFGQVVQENAKLLKAYDKVAHINGAVQTIFDTITMLRYNKINPEKLLMAGKQMTGNLKAKIYDIALLYNKYLQALGDKYLDRINKFKIVCKNIPASEEIGQKCYYFADFYNLKPLELDVIGQIAKCAKETVVGVVFGEPCDNERLYPKYICEYFENIALKNKLPLNCGYCMENLDDARKFLNNNLFANNNKQYIGETSSIELYSANSLEQEVKGVCRKIRQMVVENNYRYKDFAIICPDIEKYKKDIKMQFNIFDIPYSMENKTPLLNFAISKVFVDAVKVLRKNYRKNEIIAFSKNVLLGFDSSQVNAFEIFVDKYNMNSSDFLQDFQKGEQDVLYGTANLVRAKIIELLQIIDVKEQMNGKDIVEQVENFYNAVLQNGRYNLYVKEIAQLIGDHEKEKCNKAYSKITSILQELKDFLTSNYSSTQVYDMLIATFAKEQVKVVDLRLDSVYIGAEQGKYFGKKIVFLVGVNDGSFPNEKREIELFVNDELERLEKENIVIKPNLMTINYLDKLYTIQLLMKAREKTILSYNLENGEPSILIGQIKKMLDIKVTPMMSDENKFEYKTQDYALKIGSKSNGLQELSLYYNERMKGVATGDEKNFDYLYSRLQKEYEYQNTIKIKNEKFVKQNNLAWKEADGKVFARISAVERYFSCPFKFFCESTLRLKKQEKAELDTLVKGSFIHRMLEKMFNNKQILQLTGNEFDMKILEMCRQIITEEQFRHINSSIGGEVLEKTLYKNALYVAQKMLEVAKRSEFETVNTELSFGNTYSKLPPYKIDVNGKSYYFRGVIDRVDKFDDYVTLIDYKTSSSVDFTLKEVYYGERVQLLLYLNAYTSNVDCKPFALLYMPLPYKYSKSIDGPIKYAYSGLVRNLEDAIGHFDTECKYKDTILPIKIKADGSIDDKKLLSNNDLEIASKYVDNLIAQAIFEIESGYIEAKPFSCDNCEFGCICMNKNNSTKTRKRAGEVNTCTDDRNKETE